MTVAHIYSRKLCMVYDTVYAAVLQYFLILIAMHGSSLPGPGVLGSVSKAQNIWVKENQHSHKRFLKSAFIPGTGSNTA